jgi:hypothetical protein
MDESERKFKEAERSLRKQGSNLWFGGLTPEWQEFLITNTVEFFNEYEATMDQAAAELIKVYSRLISADPSLKHKNPFETRVHSTQ